MIWFLIAGALFISMALASSFVARAPLTPSMLYLATGLLLSPVASGLLLIDPLAQARTLEVITEVALIVSLFSAGLKLRLPLSDTRWRPAFRLAIVTLTLTVLLVAGAAVVGLGMSSGVAIILGAILAPTDPVLASDVQVEHPFDVTDLRFGLTGEASLNDATAFPFLMLGLGLLGHHDLGPMWTRWVLVDVVWASMGGLTIGLVLGTATARGILYLRRTHREAIGSDDFLALGLIATSYGLALLCGAYGFLAVFAAGLALRRVERLESEHSRPAAGERADVPAGSHGETDVADTPGAMAHAVLSFNEQLERIGEVVVVVMTGALLPNYLSWDGWWLAPVLLFAIRPAAVSLGLLGSGVPRRDQALIAWFGIRGIGSVYYLAYALTHGLSSAGTTAVISVTLMVVASSIFAHGMTVTPVMTRWGPRPRADSSFPRDAMRTRSSW